MRIALVSQEYPPETDHGGIATQTWLKARGLASRGHDVVVVSCAVDGRRSETVADGARVVRIPGYDGLDGTESEVARWTAYSRAVAAELDRIGAEAPLDVVEFPEWASEGWAWLAARRPGAGPFAIVHLHGPLAMFGHALGWPELDSELYREGVALERACLERADLVTSSSRCSAEWAARHHGLDAGAIPVLHAGVDLDLFHPAAPKATRPTIAFVGKASRAKGLDTLGEAALLLAETIPELRLEIAGRGEPGLVAGIRRSAEEAGRPDLVEDAGFVRRENLPARLARAWVVAMPSRYEGGPGFVALEAMACGTAVVASAAGGLGEAVGDGPHGALVAPGDPAALAAALAPFLADRARAAEAGGLARAHVARTAATGPAVDRIEALYAGALAGARP